MCVLSWSRGASWLQDGIEVLYAGITVRPRAGVLQLGTDACHRHWSTEELSHVNRGSTLLRLTCIFNAWSQLSLSRISQRDVVVFFVRLRFGFVYVTINIVLGTVKACCFSVDFYSSSFVAKTKTQQLCHIVLDLSICTEMWKLQLPLTFKHPWTSGLGRCLWYWILSHCPANCVKTADLYQAGCLQWPYSLLSFDVCQLYSVYDACCVWQLFKNVAERGRWSELVMEAHTMYRELNSDGALLLYTLLAELGYEVAQSNVAYILDRRAFTAHMSLLMLHVVCPVFMPTNGREMTKKYFESRHTVDPHTWCTKIKTFSSLLQVQPSPGAGILPVKWCN